MFNPAGVGIILIFCVANKIEPRWGSFLKNIDKSKATLEKWLLKWEQQGSTSCFLVIPITAKSKATLEKWLCCGSNRVRREASRL
jgi:hypothetical protein